MQINTSRYILYDNRCGRHVVETRSGTDSQFDMLFTASQSWIYRALCSIQASTPIINTAPSVANYHNTLKKAVDNQISTEKSEEEFPGSIPLSMCVGYAGGSLIFRRILGCSPDMMVVLYADRTTGEEVALRIFTAMPLSLYQFNKAVVERDIQRTVRERLEGLSGFVTYPKSLSGVRHLSSCHGWPCLVEEVMKTHSLQHLFYTMRNVIKDTLSEAIRLNLENQLHLPSHSVSPPDGTRRNPSAEKALLGIRGVLRKTIVCYRGVAGSILGAYTRNVTVNRDLLAHDILFPGIIHDTSALSIISQKESSSSNDPPFPLGLMAQIGEFWRIYGYLKTLLRLPEPVVFFLDTVKIASGVQPGRTAMQISCRRLLHIAENALTEFDALESDERAESDTSVLDFLDVQRRWHSS
uniref:Uncharacterized protein n=1 Tax=Amorphochlora amoebiformis TaxID=1561963 RepID=A0A7S0CSI0_9EUKA|mmetsp:Transcript_12506/g.19891  ORF Transcript_12506/g.19891 Transcript_12506/m.19891 type:complete len:411 (+) Transcript_12506:1-1233(+)